MKTDHIEESASAIAAQFAANSEITAKPKGNPRGRPWKKGQMAILASLAP